MKNKKEFELLNNLKYEIHTEVTKDCVIKIKEMFLTTTQTQFLDTKEKEVIKALEFLGWRKDKWQEEFEDRLERNHDLRIANPKMTDIYALINQYFNTNKVKIKCKDGAILIERIKC